MKCSVHGAGRAVALLAHDQLGLALEVGIVALVDLFAEQEQHHVGVLLDRARLAQVGQLRPWSPLRCSGARDSCESASTGMRSSLASSLSEREMSEISCWRFS